jgi:hypothetical protein
MAIPPAQVPRAQWPVLACVAGLLALATAFLPFGVGLIAVVLAAVGIAAGIAALVRAMPARHPGTAATGIVTSSVAIVLAIVMAVIYQTGTEIVDTRSVEPGWLHSTDNTDEVLREQLRVSFGVVDPGEKWLLPAKLTNRLDRAATFHFVVAGFRGHTEIARDTAYVTLAAKATQHTGMFSRYLFKEWQITQLRKAHFRVIEATTYWSTG